MMRRRRGEAGWKGPGKRRGWKEETRSRKEGRLRRRSGDDVVVVITAGSVVQSPLTGSQRSRPDSRRGGHVMLSGLQRVGIPHVQLEAVCAS